MNKEIEKVLISSVSNCRKYLAHKSISESVEDYRNYWLNETEQLKLQNNPENDLLIQNDLESINLSIEEFNEALKNETEHKEVIDRIVEKFDLLEEEEIILDLTKQLKNELPKLLNRTLRLFLKRPNM